MAAIGERGISRDRLLGFFWPDSNEDRARGALRQALYAVRRDVEEQELTIGTSELRLNSAAITSDVGEFQDAIDRGDLAAAVACYAGPFLDGIHIRDAPEFDRWADDMRRELAAKHAKSVETLTVEAMGRSDFAAAVEWARRLYVADPLNTRAALFFINALDAAGDRAGAIKQGELHTTLLRQELEVEPGADLTNALAQLRDPAVPRARTEPRTTEPAAPVAAQPGTVEPEMRVESPSGAPSGAIPPGVGRARVTPRASIAAAFVFATIVAGIGLIEFVRQRPHPGLFAIASLHAAPGDSALQRLRLLATGTIAQQVAQTTHAEVIDLRNATTSRPAGDTAGVARDVALARSESAEKVVSGTIYRVGESAVVQLQILYAANGHIVQQLDPVTAPVAQVDELLARLRDRVGGAVAALTDTLFRAWGAAGSRVPTYAAYEEFMQALDAIVHFRLIDPPDLAITHLRKAVQLDTAFSEAKIWLIEESDLLPGLQPFTDSVQATALAQRNRMTPFDQASLDDIVAVRSGNWEDVYVAAQRMVALAPREQEALYALANAQMATRRYAGAIGTLHAMESTRGWMTGLEVLWQWDMQAHHFLGDYAGGLARWRRLRAEHPLDYGICIWGIPDLVALGREAAVDSLIDSCATKSESFPPRIPNRSYFDVALQHYLAHGNLAAARRAADRIRPALAKLAPTQIPKARDLAAIHCMFGEWAVCYPKLAAATDTDVIDVRRLAVAAAHAGDTAAVSVALRSIERHSASIHRGAITLAKAMIAAARGDRYAATYLLERAQSEGLSPSGNEWRTRTVSGSLPYYLDYEWYHARELLPLHGFRNYEALIQPRR